LGVTRYYYKAGDRETVGQKDLDKPRNRGIGGKYALAGRAR